MKAKSARGASTRQRILEAAAKLTKKNGVNGTSVDDVLAASNTGKSQFYHYFTSKDGLVRELLLWHQEALRPLLGDESWSTLTDLDKLDAWLDRFVEAWRVGLFEDGCPVGSMASELAAQHDSLRAELHSLFVHWETKLAASLRTFKGRGLLKTEVQPDQLASFILASLQGSLLLCKTAQSIEPLRSTIGQLKLCLRAQAQTQRRPGATAGRSLHLGFCP